VCGQAEPVDRPVERDQRDGITVSDGGVVPNRRVTVDASRRAFDTRLIPASTAI
jgi:hypothetical protein